MKKILIFTIILTLSNCRASSDPLRNFIGSYRNYTKVNGKIKNGRFYDPYKRFSIQVPKLIEPGMITEGYFKDSAGTITFTDDFGNLVRVDVITIIDSEINSSEIDNQWQTLLPRNRNIFLNLYKQTIPESKIIHQEYIVWKEKHADYFVTHIKGGGTLSDGSGKRQDSLRASLSFINNKSFYTISIQNSNLLRDNKSNDEGIKNMLKQLKEIADTIDFIKAGKELK